MSRSAYSTDTDPSCPGPSRTQITCGAGLLLTLIQAGGAGPGAGLERVPRPPGDSLSPPASRLSSGRGPRGSPSRKGLPPVWMLTAQAEYSGELAVPGRKSSQVKEPKSSSFIAPWPRKRRSRRARRKRRCSAGVVQRLRRTESCISLIISYTERPQRWRAKEPGSG